MRRPVYVVAVITTTIRICNCLQVLNPKHLIRRQNQGSSISTTEYKTRCFTNEEKGFIDSIHRIHHESKHVYPSKLSIKNGSNTRRVFLSSLHVASLLIPLSSSYATGDNDETRVVTTATTTSMRPTTLQQQQTVNNRATLRIEILSKPDATLCSKIRSRTNDLLQFHYEARAGDSKGRIYDSSAQRGTGQPYAYVLGSGDLIPGVDQGLYDMCVGETRALTIPPQLGYGSAGVNLFKIPPYTNLYWTITLESINFITANDDRTREDLE